ncbi:MAG: ATP-binding protein, partial [Spirochaetales bacterium]|nr:ATP-binding protein [Spirochaetales bacterium]
YRLVNEGKPYFLSRPRRFGKSLLLSTLKAYFEGKKELFTAVSGQPALAAVELEKEWRSYPVFHIDFNAGDYREPPGLNTAIDNSLARLEKTWGENPKETSFPARFQGLIERAAEKTGRKVVVLIDEYDKPLLEAGDTAGRDYARDTLSSFYGVLKSADPWLKFYLITGITKFPKVSIFSELNQLLDISLMEEYAPLCGITGVELSRYFSPDIQALAEKNGMSFEAALEETRKRYNGYHFAEDTEGVYNPFSLLNTLKRKKFQYYWFETGTPTFLVKTLAKINFDLPSLKDSVTISANSIMDYRFDSSGIVPLLYQSGYLTIKGYDPGLNEYTLGFPNEEVEYGFLKELLSAYSPWAGGGRQGLYIGSFMKDLDAHNIDSLMNRFRALFSGIPYPLTPQNEYHYQTLLYLVFTLMGEFAQAEVASAAGRSDMTVMRRDTIYVFEFKLAGGGTAEEALDQIDRKGYLLPYSAEGKTLVKVGVEFDRQTRTIGRWLSA